VRVVVVTPGVVLVAIMMAKIHTQLASHSCRCVVVVRRGVVVCMPLSLTATATEMTSSPLPIRASIMPGFGPVLCCVRGPARHAMPLVAALAVNTAMLVLARRFTGRLAASPQARWTYSIDRCRLKQLNFEVEADRRLATKRGVVRIAWRATKTRRPQS
jgi:hypothetical protein